ncbi:hypothetical protein [Clostridium sp. Marseille-P299]|uniref:hypothetical protein n=1 Tax=Clostridium sp. Marseille-P299 TaxID=1805477 RepID=UPI00082D27D1|nr:hypothetical protein [Clostridium sp. Marseille-P299]
MITIFNRKELCITFSMKEQAEIRNALKAENIKYITKVINRNSSSPFMSERARTGTLGQNMEKAYEYIIYVHKKDYERAKYVINK